MLNVYAQELWGLEQQMSTNAASASQTSIDIYQGTLTYLMGMDYYKRVWEFDAFARRLYKVQNLPIRSRPGEAWPSPRLL